MQTSRALCCWHHQDHVCDWTQLKPLYTLLWFWRVCAETSSETTQDKPGMWVPGLLNLSPISLVQLPHLALCIQGLVFNVSLRTPGCHESTSAKRLVLSMSINDIYIFPYSVNARKVWGGKINRHMMLNQNLQCMMLILCIYGCLLRWEFKLISPRSKADSTASLLRAAHSHGLIYSQACIHGPSHQPTLMLLSVSGDWSKK